jgi:hypothetical protein
MKKVLLLLSILALTLAASAQTDLSLPAGTTLKIKLDNTLSSFTSRQGDPFTGRVTAAVTLGGRTIIPVGATVQGAVGRVSEKRRIQGRPTIALFPHTVVLPGGERFAVNASLVDTSLRHGTDVNDEGEFKGSGRDKKDNIEMGMGAGGGIVIGAIAGGPAGALIGGAVGGGATAVHWLSKKRSAVLPAGTELVLELNRPLVMNAAAGGQ